MLRPSVRKAAALVLCYLGIFSSSALSHSVPQPLAATVSAKLRPWTPEASVELRYIVQDQADPYRGGNSAVVSSPAGDAYFFITRRGDLGCDCDVFTITVLQRSELKAAMQSRSRRKVRTFSRSFQSVGDTSRAFDDHSVLEGIRGARWSADSSSILFISPIHGVAQVLRLNVVSGVITQETFDDDGVTEFSEGGQALLYTTWPRAVERPDIYPASYLMRWDVIPDAALLPRQRAEMDAQRAKRAIGVINGNLVPLPNCKASSASFYYLSVAPNGTQALCLASDNSDYVLLKFRDRSQRVVDKLDGMRFDGRFSGGFAWSPSGDQFAARIRNDSSFAIQIVAQDGTSARIADNGRISWTNDTTLVVTRTDGDQVTYKLNNGSWTSAPESGPSIQNQTDSLRFIVREDANTPQSIVVVDGKQQLQLLDQDPVVSRFHLTPMRTFTWKGPTGEQLSAGLLLPEGIAKSGLPLVIQAYHYLPGQFLPDGPHPGTSDAAQVLVAKGFAVLQIESMREINTPGEGTRFVGLIDSAISALVARGTIDPNRIALTGFSRGGYQTLFAVSHPGRFRIAAAVCDDSFTGSFGAYLSARANGSPAVAFPYGGEFWNAEPQWRADDPIFNANRVQTPILCTQRGVSIAKGYQDRVLETIGAFRVNRRPIDFLFFPYSGHQLMRPNEKIVLMNAVADWLSFWILGTEDSSPEKNARYVLWRKMKSDWERQQKWEAAGHPIGSLPE